MSSWHTLQIDFQAMASPCRLILDGQDGPAMEEVAQACIAETRRIEHKYSRYRPDSVISQINAAAGRHAVPVDEETSALLDFAHRLWEMSDHLFDITSGVLRRAWDFRAARLPEPGAIEALLPCVGWEKVVRNPGQVALMVPGMELDFGGFGKEYAADRVAALLIEAGYLHALVNLGGDLHATGPRMVAGREGQAWSIDIENPRPAASTDSEPLIALNLSRGGLATSGDYERFFLHEGRRYCHVLDPNTGWPVTGVQSVSVVAPSTTIAGALATIAMLMGASAPAWLADQQVDFYLVDGTGQRIPHKAGRSACPQFPN